MLDFALLAQHPITAAKIKILDDAATYLITEFDAFGRLVRRTTQHAI
jgi:hypothetical protein